MGAGNMARWLLAPMVLLVLCMGFMPAQAHAWVGPVKGYATDATVSTSVQGQTNVAQIKNDYITFEIDTKGGLRCRTVPTKFADGTLEQSVKKGVYQELKFTVKNRRNGKEETLTPATVVAEEGSVYGMPNAKVLGLSYTFKNSDLRAGVGFYLVEATEGVYSGEYDFPVTLDDYGYYTDQHGKTYIIQAAVGITAPTSSPSVYVSWSLSNKGFTRFGHEDEKNPKKAFFSSGSIKGGRVYGTTINRQTHDAELTDLSKGLKKTAVGPWNAEIPITEACVMGYNEANPFVVFNHVYDDGTVIYDGVSGWDGENHGILRSAADWLEYSSSGKGTLKTYSTEGGTGGNPLDEDTYMSYQIWGYRNLYKQNESAVELVETESQTQSEFAYVKTNAARLAVVPTAFNADGSAKAASVKELAAGDAVPKDALAVYSGTFKYIPDKGKEYYDFTAGAAYLSPTVSANFDTKEGGYFRLKRDGTVLHKDIRLSVPLFCFYKPKDLVNGVAPTFSYVKGKGLVVGLEPANNEAFIKVDIPYAKTKLETATIDTAGNISLSGALGITSVFDSAEFDLERLSLGNNKAGQFKLNGLKASIDAEDLDLFGLEIEKAKGQIDTFSSKYDFELEVNAFDLFEFGAALQLKKHRNGTLMPNKLYGELSTGYGIPLVAPAPVAELTGGGIGFDNLVDTLNEEYMFIPPVKLIITAKGKVIKVIEGKLTAAIGPSGIQVTGKDLSIPNEQTGVKIVDELSLGLGWTGTKKTYDGVEYKGVNVNGALDLETSFAGKSGWKDVVVVDGAVDLNAFGGTGYKGSQKQLYFLVDTAGKIRATLRFPSGWKVIGGRKIASLKALFSAGLYTVVPLTEANVSTQLYSALKNVNGYVGVCAEASICNVYGRVWYVTPDKVDGGVYWGKPSDIDLKGIALGSQSEDGSLPLTVAGLYDGNGEQVGIAVYDSGLAAQEASLDSQDEGDGSRITVSLPEGENVTGKTAVFELNVQNGAAITKDELLGGLTVDGVAVKEIVTNETTGENANGGNVIVHFAENEDGSPDESAITRVSIFLDNAKTEWTIASTNAKFTCDDSPFMIAEQKAYEGFQDVELTAGTAGSPATLSGKVVNLDEDEAYELHVYMGVEKESGDYSVCEPIQIPRGLTEYSFADIAIPVSGELAASGEYYVSAALVRSQSGDFNGDGAVSGDETAQIAFAHWNAGSKITYTNDNAPAAPASVSAAPAGNETLACTFSEVANADGYRVRIYKDGEDTGFGYSLTMENGELTCAGSTMAISHEGGTFSAILAPTVSGQSPDDEGARLEPLQPGGGYQLGVSSYRFMDRDEMQYPVYSDELLSGEATIAEYAPAEFTVKVNGKNVAADSETGLYNAAVPPDNRQLDIEVTSDGTYTIDAVREVAEGADASMEDALHADGKTLSAELAEFEGAATYDIAITNTATKDRTLAFLQVSLDDVPPTLLLDEDVALFGDDGTYTVAGSTDGERVYFTAGESFADEDYVEVGQDGRFSVTGQSLEHYGILQTTKIEYEWCVTETEDYADDEQEYFDGWIESLPGMVGRQVYDGTRYSELAGYEVLTPTWTGAGEYKVVYRFVDRVDATESARADLESRLQNNEIVSMTDVVEEEEISADKIGNYTNLPNHQKLVEYDRACDGMTTLTLGASDECGNCTRATVRLLPHEHTIEKVAEVPATCSEAGTRAHYECAECGAAFEDELGLTPAGDLTIPKNAKGHTYGAWTVTKEATVLAAGSETRTCTGCGHVETRSIAKLEATIKLAAGKINVAKTTIPLKKKQKLAKIVVTMNAGDKIASVKSSKPKIVKASIKGNKVVLKATKKTGKAKVTVKTTSGATASFAVKVQEKNVVATKIVGFKKKVTLKKGEVYRVPGDIVPVSVPDKVKFKTSDKKVAAVSTKGVVRARKAGKANVTAIVGKKKFKCVVTVK